MPLAEARRRPVISYLIAAVVMLFAVGGAVGGREAGAATDFTKGIFLFVRSVGGTGSFTVDVSDGGGGATFTNSTAVVNSPVLVGGVHNAEGLHTVSWSAVPSGWVANGVVCTVVDGNGASTTVSGPSVQLTMTLPARADCVLEAILPGSVTVGRSVTSSTVHAWTATYGIDPVPSGQPATRDVSNTNPYIAWHDLDPDTAYEITETIVSDGVEHSSQSCTGAESSTAGATSPEHQVSFTTNDDATDVVKCTFVDALLPSVSVTKYVSPQSAVGWTADFVLSPPVGSATQSATPTSPTVSWTGLSLGQSYTITELEMVNFSPGTLVCTGLSGDDDGSVSGEGTVTFEPEAGDQVECSITNVRQAPGLSLAKSAVPTAPQPGGLVVWTITASNGGPFEATDAVVEDVLPATLTLDSFTAPAGWDCSATQLGRPATLHCEKPQMSDGESATFVLRTLVAADAELQSTILNTATLTTDEGGTPVVTQSQAGIVVSDLPVNGSSSRRLALIAAGLVAVGLAFELIRRRRTA